MILVEVREPTIRQQLKDFNLNKECLRTGWTLWRNYEIRQKFGRKLPSEGLHGDTMVKLNLKKTYHKGV